MNYEVALVVKPILSVDMLTRIGVLAVFGIQGGSSFIQWPDGHISHQRKRSNGFERDIGWQTKH